MADKIIKIKIDVKKIDKAKLYVGEKGTYLNATLFLKEEPDGYGNFGMVTQDVSEAERKAGVKGPILGNVKIVGGQGPVPEKNQGNAQPVDNDEFSDLPF